MFIYQIFDIILDTIKTVNIDISGYSRNIIKQLTENKTKNTFLYSRLTNIVNNKNSNHRLFSI